MSNISRSNISRDCLTVTGGDYSAAFTLRSLIDRDAPSGLILLAVLGQVERRGGLRNLPIPEFRRVDRIE